MLQINARCRLIGIPDAAHGYTISGRSPLQWAIASLRHKHHKPSGITDDPNEWEASSPKRQQTARDAAASGSGIGTSHDPSRTIRPSAGSWPPAVPTIALGLKVRGACRGDESSWPS